jgi:hypothetical protein
MVTAAGARNGAILVGEVRDRLGEYGHAIGNQRFWQDEVDAFHTAHPETKRAELTIIDRSGDPNELVGSGTATKILGCASHRNLPDALSNHPDRVETLPSGRIRRRWYQRTVWAVADLRTGRQSTGRTTGPRKPHLYADDPRLSAALDLIREANANVRPVRGLGVELARRLGIPPRTAKRIIATLTEPQPV